MRSLEDVLKEMANILENLKMEYVIVGGIAVAAWGNIRTTRNIDIIVSLEEKDCRKFAEAFADRGFVAREEDLVAALRERSHFTIFDRDSEYRIDAKGIYSEIDGRTMERRREVSLDEVDIWVASPEDLIASKLLFGGEQDRMDAEEIYLRQFEKLDLKYLEESCKLIGVYDEFIKMKRALELK